MRGVFPLFLPSSAKQAIVLWRKVVIVIEQQTKKPNSTMKVVRATMTQLCYGGVSTCPKLGYMILF